MGRCLLLFALKMSRFGADLTFLRPFFTSGPLLENLVETKLGGWVNNISAALRYTAHAAHSTCSTQHTQYTAHAVHSTRGTQHTQYSTQHTQHTAHTAHAEVHSTRST